MNCKICHKLFKNIGGLECHITKIHKETNCEQYYLFYENGQPKYCQYCNKPTSFKNLLEGYRQFCDRTCSTSFSNKNIINIRRKNWSKDKKENYKVRLQNTWKNKTNEEKNAHKNKISLGIKKISKIISHKRRDTMNQWDDQRKELYKEKIKNAWKNKTPIEFEKKYQKQKNTNINKNKWIPINLLSEFQQYQKLVRKETKKHILNLFNQWDGLDYYDQTKLVFNDVFLKQNPTSHVNANLLQPTVDHIVSIFDGFVNKIDYKEIGNIKNLCICSRLNNSKKIYKNKELFLKELRDKKYEI